MRLEEDVYGTAREHAPGCLERHADLGRVVGVVVDEVDAVMMTPSFEAPRSPPKQRESAHGVRGGFVQGLEPDDQRDRAGRVVDVELARDREAEGGRGPTGSAHAHLESTLILRTQVDVELAPQSPRVTARGDLDRTGNVAAEHQQALGVNAVGVACERLDQGAFRTVVVQMIGLEVRDDGPVR